MQSIESTTRRHNVSCGKTSRQEVMKNIAMFAIQQKEFEAGPKFKFCNKKNSIESQRLLYFVISDFSGNKTLPQQCLDPSTAIRNAETK